MEISIKNWALVPNYQKELLRKYDDISFGYTKELSLFLQVYAGEYSYVHASTSPSLLELQEKFVELVNTLLTLEIGEPADGFDLLTKGENGYR